MNSISSFNNNYGSKSYRNPGNMLMKSISNKSTNGMYNKPATKGRKSGKHSYTAKKGGKGKKNVGEKMNIVPFNGYVPDIIQNEFCNSNQ
mmetsp:Transcript_15400/g.13449  ORF Transcript_15400/g.13449 Transcript_15400/m.13449 type:complete len:90 (+) Transcript_15400:582-851(+)